MNAREELINILSGGHESNKHAMGLVADMILRRYRSEIADGIHDLAQHWSSGDAAEVAEFVRTGEEW